MFKCGFSSPLSIVVTETQRAVVMHGRDLKCNLEGSLEKTMCMLTPAE